MLHHKVPQCTEHHRKISCWWWCPTLNPIWWISPIKTSQVGDIWLFCYWRCTDTHTPGDSETCITYKSSAQAYSFSPDRNLEPGSKGTDIGMQLTLATVWVVNILPSISVSLSPSFFSPSSCDPWLSEWLTATASGSLVMNSNMKLQRVTSRYACHNR